MKLTHFPVMLAVVILGCGSPDSTSPTSPDTPTTPVTDSLSIHVALGVPIDGNADDDFIIRRTQYQLSYSGIRNAANWVSWNLNAAWYGDAERSGSFLPDPDLPAQWYHPRTGDYTNSGYDRGHLVRSEERTRSGTDNVSTFYLSNILPQAPDMNQGVWLNLEYWCQDLCQKHNHELFIIAGGVFHTGRTVGNVVAIPDSCWKIVVVLERGQGLRDVTTSTPVYAAMIPNIAGVRSDTWDTYQTTVDRIEASTGYDFLSAVAKDVQTAIESHAGTFTTDIPHPATRHATRDR